MSYFHSSSPERMQEELDNESCACEDEINELHLRIDELEDQTRDYEYLVTGAQLLVENARVAHERDHRHSLKWCPEIMCASLRDHGLVGGDR